VKLRIVMPVLNEGDGLLSRLRALAPLREQGAQVVVVDGGSTDSTWAVATRWADHVLLAPRGRATQMNAGATAPCAGAQPDTLLFLHADTRLPPDADHLIEAALRGGRAWGRFDVKIEGRHPLLPVVATLVNWRSRLSGIATGDQGMFMTSAAFSTAGGFAPQPLMEDIALSTRLRRVSPPACLPQRVSTSGRRWDRHGLWRTIGLMWRLRAAYALGASPQALALRYGYTVPPPIAEAAVAVMAKAPVAGLAKTRLIPALGAVQAARAQRRFTLNTVQVAQAFTHDGKLPLVVWCAPDHHHRLFRALKARKGIDCQAQPPGDLGHRMAHAFQQHFATSPQPLPLLLVGTDCPTLSPGHLQLAATALSTHDVVLIPAEDGGYVLIGMRRFVPQAFEQVDWSTPQVLEQTRTRLRQAGASWAELPALWDVDEPADWLRLQTLTHPDLP
jgi:rSAM/selenodomain-associated transferase 2/rSAM/selenodomain-associated transferase 1